MSPKARLEDAEVKRCISCPAVIIAYTPAHIYCAECLKKADRKRSLDRYYRLKLEEGKPLHSPMGRPIVPNAPVVADTIVYASNKVDRSNRPYKLTCHRGHPLDGENLHIDTSGRRICRTCKRETLRNSRHPKPAIEEPKPIRNPDMTPKERRKYEMIAPVAELWPYGLEDPLIIAIAQAMPSGIPDWVRADAGQQVYLQCLEGQVSEGNLTTTVSSAIKSAWGEYAISLDWRPSDGFSIADRLEG